MDTRKFISCHLGQQRRQWRWASSGGGGEIRDLYNINSKWSVVRRRRPEWSFGETCNRLNQQSEWIGEGARALHFAKRNLACERIIIFGKKRNSIYSTFDCVCL